MGVLPTIAVVTQETRLKGLRGRWATAGAAKFRLRQAHLIERQRATENHGADELRAFEQAMDAADFDAYEEEDIAYRTAFQSLRDTLDFGYPTVLVERLYLPNFDFGRCVVVVVLGQDGLVANAAKYVGDLPIVGVNPDPKRIDGVLVPFGIKQARRAVEHALEDRARTRAVSLAEVRLNDGQRMLAFNDFFLGARSHVSARYVLRAAGRAESQSSSGIVISTGAGSTGWLSSMFNMAEGFVGWLGGQVERRVALRWEDRRLVWVVREPFRSKHSGSSMVAGLIEEGEELVVESLMPQSGVIFSDGVENDFLEFSAGTIATFSISPHQARLVVGW